MISRSATTIFLKNSRTRDPLFPNFDTFQKIPCILDVKRVTHFIFQVGQNAETEKLAFKKLEECVSKPVLFSGGVLNC